MSIRKRTWKTAAGEAKEAWILDYVDQAGKRHIKTFQRKKDASEFSTTIMVEVRDGTHTASSQSVKVSDAGEKWIATAEKNGLERSTVDQYRQHLRLHINPYLGAHRLSELSAPMIRDFEDRLRKGTAAPGQGVDDVQPRSQALTRKVMVSLGSMLADAQERGLVARNVVRDLRTRRTRGKERRSERRQKGKLKVGVDIPTREEIKAIVDALSGRWRPLLLTAIFTGLRASELRGLHWGDVDLDARLIHVRQRADRYNAMGAPKSEAGERSVPLPPIVLSTLREWKLICPRKRADDGPGQLGLVFPTGTGNIESLGNIINRALIPVQLAAGVTVRAKSADGKPIIKDRKPVVVAKYTGMHALRHFYASWCINRKADGGLELPGKVVQERMGHSSIMMTMDVYGHLFPRNDDGTEMADAERALLG